MVSEAITENAEDIAREIAWVRAVLETRSDLNAGKESKYNDVREVPVPDLSGDRSEYAKFVHQQDLGFAERFLIALSLVPHVMPELLDMFLQRNGTTQSLYTEFGGRVGKAHNGFLPTGETFMFVLAGKDLARRFALSALFSPDHPLQKEHVVTLSGRMAGEPYLSGTLSLSTELVELFVLGKVSEPTFSSEFPAKQITTTLDWSDLILDQQTAKSLAEIDRWLLHNETLMVDHLMSRKLRPGYRALFYGPPGTGKTLTASLMGKRTGRPVYRIDLSAVVSKYIGETEKNLSRIFDKAENKDWILFFDEADALFGKRTKVNDAHDRYANQEVSYLLQRVEDYHGLVILASNMKNNIDDAFTRRFNAMINFPKPGPVERRILWENSLPAMCEVEPRVDLDELARKYELTGGAILNVVQHAALLALDKGDHMITERNLTEGIRIEYHRKELTI